MDVEIKKLNRKITTYFREMKKTNEEMDRKLEKLEADLKGQDEKLDEMMVLLKAALLHSVLDDMEGEYITNGE